MTSRVSFTIEILEAITSHVDDTHHLYQLALVNKSFYADLNYKLWEAPIQRKSKASQLGLLLKCLERSQNHINPLCPGPLGHIIRKIWIQPSDSLDEILQLFAWAPLVEELNLDNDRIVDRDLKHIVRLCPRVKKISLNCPSMTICGLLYLVKYCHYSLCALSLKNMSLKSIKALRFSKNCTLEHLELNECSMMTAGVAKSLSSYNCLTSLKLHHSSWGIINDFIQQLLPTETNCPLPLLKHLDLCCTRTPGFCIDNDDRWTVAPFVRSHPDLESLSLVNAIIGKASLVAIADRLSSLRHLCLDGSLLMSYRWTRRLIKSCPQLVSFSFKGSLLSKWPFPEIVHDEFFESLQRQNIERIRSASTADLNVLDDSVAHPLGTFVENRNLRSDSD